MYWTFEGDQRNCYTSIFGISKFLADLLNLISPPPAPPPPPGRDHVLEGRRSQGGLNLKSLEFGLFGAFNYKVDTFRSLIFTEVRSLVVRSS